MRTLISYCARGALVLLGVVVLGGCDAQPLEPGNTGQPGGIQPAAGMPVLVENSVPYREQSHKHATGRAGSARLTVRALLGRDGKVEVEVTTGVLGEPESAPGRITKVQLKLLDPGGVLRGTLNYDGLDGGGTWTGVVPSWGYPGSVQVQANVRGIDPARTGVVTLTEPVKLRPDVAALGVDAPAEIETNTTTILRAAVAERNGDVGAKAACRLYENGKRIDTAEDITVVERGVVECAFPVSWSSPGRRELEVRVEDVRPGDWEESNNAAVATVEVVEPAGGPVDARLTGVLEAAEVTATVDNHSYMRYDNGDGSWTEEGFRDGWSSRVQSVTLRGEAPVGSLSFPVDALNATLSTGGSLVSRVSGLSIAQTVTLENGERCGQAFADGNAILVCSGSSGVHLEITRSQEDATYYSESYMKLLFPGVGEEGVFYHSERSPGTLVAFGADFAMDIRIDDDGSVFRASPLAALTTSHTDWVDQWRQCDTSASYEVCSAVRQMQSTTAGRVAF